MKISLAETKFSSSWEGDGMRRGDNIRSDSWTRYYVQIDMTEDESEYLVSAIKEYDRQRSLAKTVDQVESDLINRAAHLEWCAKWSKFYRQDQGGWHVGIDCAPADRPEIYDDGGNFIGFLPRDITPGDFTALTAIVSEMFAEME